MNGALYLFVCAIPFSLIWLTMSIWEWRESMCARSAGTSLTELAAREGRCSISRQDAAWLAAALHDPDCPACDAPLARHR